MIDPGLPSKTLTKPEQQVAVLYDNTIDHRYLREQIWIQAVDVNIGGV
jgi:hypothetical protein